MNQMRAVLIMGLAALPLAACQKDPPPAPASPSVAASAGETPAAPATPAATPTERPNGDFKIIGLVTKVEDAGYPMSVLTVLPDGEKDTLSLLYNNEEASRPKDIEISGFESKRAEIAYSRRPQFDLMDLTLAGATLLKREPNEVVGHVDTTVTGKLSGAKALSAGDLPDVITVTDAAGKKYDFEMFISDKPVVAANGKEVTAAYANSQREDVKSIAVAPPKP